MDFLGEDVERAERAFQRDLLEATLVGEDGETPIKLDFASMTQTGKVKRKIRRVALLKN